MSHVSLCGICKEAVHIMGSEFRSTRSRGWENRFASHHNIQVNIETAKDLFRDSVCRVEHRRTRMYLKGVVFVRER